MATALLPSDSLLYADVLEQGLPNHPATATGDATNRVAQDAIRNSQGDAVRRNRRENCCYGFPNPRATALALIVIAGIIGYIIGRETYTC